MLFRCRKLKPLLDALADDHQIYLGTSSWKYEGWCGMLYDEERYLWKGTFSKASFERSCLQEYAACFSTVCVDATYYRFPKPEYIEGLMAQVSEGFKFSFKVPDEITIKNFPEVKSFGDRAGKANDGFLNALTLEYLFLRYLEPFRSKVGMLIFEFSHFSKEDYEHGQDFVAELDQFFSDLPKGWQYGVEVRNQNLLHPEYFATLKRHGVAHIYNQWTHMPPVNEQMALHGLHEGDFVAARYLLKPHHNRHWAEEKMAPYHRIYEVDVNARESLTAILRHLICAEERAGKPSFLYIGNQLEGNALHTIADVLERVLGDREA
ncbi:MAG: DUF72 domain-containing protein [Verrucomicrobiales bacterium]|nr:DUF72 domain-containing protein [Verrucomicrobiales bacterium]